MTRCEWEKTAPKKECRAASGVALFARPSFALIQTRLSKKFDRYWPADGAKPGRTCSLQSAAVSSFAVIEVLNPSRVPDVDQLQYSSRCHADCVSTVLPKPRVDGDWKRFGDLLSGKGNMQANSRCQSRCRPVTELVVFEIGSRLH